MHGGSVLNVTIDRYAYAIIKTLNNNVIRFIATDQQLEVTNNIGDELELDGKLNLHKAVYNEIIQQYNNGNQISLELSTFCDAPIGSGLGASSTLVVAMIKAFIELLNIPLDDYAIANLAFKIERVNCKLQGGRQDQYSATFGGFNFMEFYINNHAIINSLRVKSWIICELEASLLMFYTGISRESAKIIKDQSDNVKAKLEDVIEAMHGMKHEALIMKECLLKGDFVGLVDIMKQGWENKKRSAKTVSNAHLDMIYNEAINAGALAGKVSGAGGGGFMLFFVPSNKRMAVIRTLNKFDGQVSNCHFTKHGAQAWRIL